MKVKLTTEFLLRIIESGKDVPKGPWASSRNCTKFFPERLPDWGEVFATVRFPDGEIIEGCIIARANTNFITQKEEKQARKEYLEKHIHTNPGLSGKISEYIAGLPPDVTTAMSEEIIRLRGKLDVVTAMNDAANKEVSRLRSELELFKNR